MTDGLLLGRYALKHEIHKSPFVTVWRAKDTETEQTVAIKVVPNSIESDELEILRILHHENIVSVLDSAHDDENTYIVLKYIHGLPITEHKRPKSDRGLIRLIRQIVKALAYLEENGIVHRRFEPGHILVDGVNHITIIGFGRAVRSQDAGQCHSCGSAAYLAPEFIKGEAPSPASDMWSCGVSLYQVIVGQFPFDEADVHDLLNAIVRMKAMIPDWVSAEIQSLLKRMLDKNPKLRASATALAAEEWLNREKEPDQMPAKPKSMHNLNRIYLGLKKSEMSSRDVPMRLSPAKVCTGPSWRELKNLL